MSNPSQIVADVYYVAASFAIVGTTLRFMWTFFKTLRHNWEFAEELEVTHLPNIYSALKAIGDKLDIQFDFETPYQPRPKTPPED